MGKIAFLFAGQGAQHTGMGKDLYEKNAAAKAVFNLVEQLRPATIKQCFESDKAELSLTENTQPCLFAVDLACATALKDAGIVADAVAGFSLGELAALGFSGVLSYADAFKLVVTRARAMQICAEKYPGGMVAVLGLDSDIVEHICDDIRKTEGFEIWPVNYNCPGQTVAAGTEKGLEVLSGRACEAKGKVLKLTVNGAFHTPFMAEATAILRDKLRLFEIFEPNIAIYSNLSATKYAQNATKIRECIAAQASSSVKWEQTIRNMHAEGVDTFIEVGPGKILSGFIPRILKNVKILNVSDLSSLNATMAEMSQKGDVKDA